MSIRRGPRPDTRFYTVSKDLSEDTRLSWAARGMLIYLLGKPDNWEVSVGHLIKQTEDSPRPSGRDAVRGIIKELIDAGYMQADIRRQEGGTFNGMNYVVHELPMNPEEQQEPQTENTAADESPQTDNPLTVEPKTAEPLTVNPPLIKNEYQQGMIEETKTDSQQTDEADKSASLVVGEAVPAALPKSKRKKQDENEDLGQPPEWLPIDAWVSFVEMRKAMGSRGKLTMNAARLIIKKLEELKSQGQDPRLVLEQSVMNNWKGVFPIKGFNNGNRQQALEDRNRQAINDFVQG